MVTALHALPTLLCLAQVDSAATARPWLAVEGDGVVPNLESLHTTFTVNGPIARVRINQIYENDGATPVDVVYAFPVPAEAAVHGMRMVAGARVVEARIERREAARAIFEEARAAGQDAALLEQQQPNVMTMEIANLRPDETVEIDVDYSQIVPCRDGDYELALPGIVASRFTDESALERWMFAPFRKPRWSVDGVIEASVPVVTPESPTHEISVDARGGGAVGVYVDSNSSEDDFVLRWRLGGAALASGVLTHSDETGHYFLATVAPPTRPAERDALPRELVFILDVSCSMVGAPLDAGKALIRKALRGLRPDDRFNVIFFADHTMVLFEAAIEPSPGAFEYVDQILTHNTGGGGTRLLGALQEGFDLPRNGARATAFVVVTDGLILASAEVHRLATERRGDAAIFPFGVGGMQNEALLDALARAGGGEAVRVTDDVDAIDATQRLLNDLDLPVLTEITVDAGAGVELAPAVPSDVYAGRTLFIVGRSAAPIAGPVLLQGRLRQRPWSATLDIARPPGEGAVALPLLFARRRVRELADRESLGADHEAEIEELGLRFAIATEHTSFVAVDEAGRHATQPHDAPRDDTAAAQAALAKLFGSSRGAGGGRPRSGTASLATGGGATALGGLGMTGGAARRQGAGPVAAATARTPGHGGGSGTNAHGSPYSFAVAGRGGDGEAKAALEFEVEVDGPRAPESVRQDIERQARTLRGWRSARFEVTLVVAADGSVTAVENLRAPDVSPEAFDALEAALGALRFRPRPGDGATSVRVRARRGSAR